MPQTLNKRLSQRKTHKGGVDNLRITREIKAGPNVPQEVVNHIENNLVLATNVSSICVDGGYRPEEAMGELARAGGDLGLSLALIKLGFSPQEAFQVVLVYRKSVNQKYGWHSDTHSEESTNHEKTHKSGEETHQGISCGCGHWKAAYDNAVQYKLETGQVKILLETVKEHQKNHPEDMRYVELDRSHNEEGIIMIDDREITVLPWDQQTNKQFFVYDRARDIKLIEAVGAYINQHDEFPDVDVAELKRVIHEQTMATLSLLESSKGKPIYLLLADKSTGAITVEKEGNAPKA